MSLTEHPFLYDIVAVLGTTSSSGFFLRFGTAGWYCVTKGKIPFFVLFLWRRACVFS